jgi:hypothetical protein
VNFTKGRDGHIPQGLIDHWIGSGTLDSAVAYFQTPRPANPTSAHFVVGTTGRIVQLIDVADTAYQAGVWATNLLTVGIEHEVTPDLPATDALYAASAWLHAKLAADMGINLVVGFTVRPHSAVVPTTCPGTLDVARIVSGDMTDDELFAAFQRIYPGKVEELVKPSVRVMVEQDPETRAAIVDAVKEKLG